MCSKFNFDTPENPDLDELEKSERHLVMTHRKIVDSIHQVNTGAQVSYYKVILEERANSLLMSEDTMSFYQYNLGILPEEGIKFALAYLLKILNILLKYQTSVQMDMHRHVGKARKRFGVEQSALKAFEDKDISDIIREFEESCNTIGNGEV